MVLFFVFTPECLSELTSFLGILGGPPKEAAIVFHQLSDEQESIDGCDAVGNKAGDIFTLSTSFALDEGLIPQSTELRVVLLYLRGEFFLTEADLFKRVIMACRLFYWKHEGGIMENG